MLALCNLRRSVRPDGRAIGRLAKKSSPGQNRLRRLAAEPLERRELLSADPLLYTFENPTPGLNDYFGYMATAIVGDHDYVLLGAPGDDTAGPEAGAAYLYDAATPNRQLVATLLNPNPALGNRFGGSFAFSGANILVGSNGAAYLYSPDDATGQSWHLEKTFLAPTNAAIFGTRVTVVNDKFVISGSQYSAEVAGNVGAAYVFDSNTGQLLHTFVNPTPTVSDYFARSITVIGNDVLIGAPGDSSGKLAGSVFRFDTDTGELVQTIQAPVPVAGDAFGWGIAVSDDGRILVGAPTNPSYQAEAVYLFDSAGQWLRTIDNPTKDFKAQFGDSLAFVGNNILVGAWRDNTVAFNAGAAYLFDGSSGERLRTYFAPAPSWDGRFGAAVASLGDQVLMANPGAMDRNDYAVYLFEGNHPTTGDISGRIFADLNNNGMDDDGAALPAGFKVFLDGYLPGTTPNGQLDEGEPWTNTFAKSGNFVFYDLEPGTYTVAQVAPYDTWTPTIASQTVEVVAGKSAAAVLATYIPTGVATYSANGLPRTVAGSSMVSQLSITDSRTVLDLDLTLDATVQDPSRKLYATLRAPDDVNKAITGFFGGMNRYHVTFNDEGPMTIDEAAPPYASSYQTGNWPLSNVDLSNVNGTWDLTVSGFTAPSKGGKVADTLNGWSITVTYALVPPASRPPTLVSLSDSPDPVAPGQTVTLTANVTDDRGVASVAFYTDFEGAFGPGLQGLVGVDTNGADGWSLTIPIPSTTPSGSYTDYYAQATDIDGNLSNVLSTRNVVKTSGKPRGGWTSALPAVVTADQSFERLESNLAALSKESADPSALRPATKSQNGRTRAAVDALLTSDRLDAEWLPLSKYEESATMLSQEQAKHRPLIDLALEDAATSILDERLI